MKELTSIILKDTRTHNKFFVSEDGLRGYIVFGGEQTRPEWEDMRPAYMIDGDWHDEDTIKPVILQLIERISNVGGIQLSGVKDHITPRLNGKMFEKTMLEFYGNKITDADIVNLLNNRRVTAVDTVDDEERSFIRDHYVYDFTKGNIIADTSGASFANKNVFIEPPLMGIEYAGQRHYTTYDQGLQDFLQRVPRWYLQDGALKTMGKSNCDSLPFSKIVIGYHTGKIESDTDSVRETLKDLTKKYSGIVFDHLTERPDNNIPFLLAPGIKQSTNSTAGDVRTRIKKPYFFLTVYNHATDQCFVHCGKQGEWERKFVFGSLMDSKEATLYMRCIRDFKEIVKAAECLMDKPGDESLMYYWGDVHRIFDKGNPLTALTKEPYVHFGRFNDGSFYGLN